MLNNMIGMMMCDLCGSNIVIDESATLSDYAIMLSVNSSNITDKIDEILNKYLIYTCTSCGRSVKYSYKDLESNMRKQITKKVLMMIIKNQIDFNFEIQDKFLIYCGKCTGLDGIGSCTKSIYNKCDIKRFPINEL